MDGTFHVRLERRAEREFTKLPRPARSRFYQVFRALAEDPYRPRPGCDIRVLEGEPDIRAVRVGHYRATYHVDEHQRIIRVNTIGHRRSVYR